MRDTDPLYVEEDPEPRTPQPGAIWPNALEYDANIRALVETERLPAENIGDPPEWGVASVVATNVAPHFGIWAEAMWRDGVIPEPRTYSTNPVTSGVWFLAGLLVAIAVLVAYALVKAR